MQANNSAFCYAYPAASAELWDSGTYPDSAYSVYQYTADTHYFGAGGVQSGAGVAGERTEVLTIMGKVKDAGTYTLDLTNVVAGNGAAPSGVTQQFQRVTEPAEVTVSYGAVEDSNLSLTASASAVTEGDSFTVTVNMRSAMVSSFTGHLEFNNDMLKCVGITTGAAYDALATGALSAQLSAPDGANSTGKLGWGFAYGAEAVYAGGELLTVEFRAIGSGTTNIGLYEISAGTSGFKGGNGAAATVEVAAQHPHAFDQQVAEPEYLVSGANCEQAAVYYLSCVCGEPGTETFTYGDALGHDFSAEKAEEQYRVPDTTDQYYKSCIRCGKAGTETFVPSTEGMLLLRIVPQQTTFCPNAADRTVKFDVVIEQNPGLTYLYFAFDYDESQMTLTGFETTSVFTGTWLPESDVLAMKGANCNLGTTDVTATGVIATVTFTVSENMKEGNQLTFGLLCDPYSEWGDTMNSKDEPVPVDLNGASRTMLIAHTYDQEVATDGYLATPATCTKQATYYKSCACGAKGTETFASGDLLPHTWGDGKVTTQPTCTEPGVMTYTCQNCDATKTAAVDALGHKLDETPAKEETCTEPGNSRYYTCQRCGKFFDGEDKEKEIKEGSWVIPAKDHDFAAVSATPASADKDGVLHLACTRCKEESTESFTFDAAAVQLTVGTADGSAKIHRGTIEVPVTLTGAAVNGMSMTVVYDETRLTLTGVSGGWTLSGNTVSTDSAVSAGTAVTLTFTVATDEGSFVNPGDAAISIGETTAQGTDGALTVGQTAGKVVITKAGDINGDGKVNAADLMQLQRYIAARGRGVPVVTGSTNVNNDSKAANAADMMLLQRYIASRGKGVVIY
mgnify:CR=1 FL=1